MQLHGEEISVGDSVYDLLDGWMDVVDTDATTFTVRIRNAYRMYNTDGRAEGRDKPTVFWHNPIVITPNKRAVSWSMQRSNLRRVFDIMTIHARVIEGEA